MASVSVRYIVDDVNLAIDFYAGLLEFEVVMHPAPPFAMLKRGDLMLLLSQPSSQGGGGQILADGSSPEPGGWNRFQIEVDDLDAAVEALRAGGASFRSEIITGVGGRQILVDDPAGNPVELFESFPG